MRVGAFIGIPGTAEGKSPIMGAPLCGRQLHCGKGAENGFWRHFGASSKAAASARICARM
jgi:hypothetical protein